MRKITIVLVLIAVGLVGFAVGRLTIGGGTFDAEKIKKEFPLFAPPPKTAPFETISAVPAPEKDLVLETPVDNTAVEESIEVTGRVRADNHEVAIIVKDGAGNEIVQTTADLATAATGEFARFSKMVAFLPQPPGNGSIEVFLRDKEGNPISEKAVRVLSFVAPHTVPVKVFFSNTRLDPEISCTKVFPVDRQVSSKTQVYRSVIEELIAGPTVEEKSSGYYSSMPAGVLLKSIAADANGIVTADFNDALDRGVAGSCRVNSIRAQIVTTLEQFPEVRGVVISIGNRVEDVLQP